MESGKDLVSQAYINGARLINNLELRNYSILLCHSRESGNPDPLFPQRIWILAFAGMTEKRVS